MRHFPGIPFSWFPLLMKTSRISSVASQQCVAAPTRRAAETRRTAAAPAPSRPRPTGTPPRGSAGCWTTSADEEVHYYNQNKVHYYNQIMTGTIGTLERI